MRSLLPVSVVFAFSVACAAPAAAPPTPAPSPPLPKTAEIPATLPAPDARPPIDAGPVTDATARARHSAVAHPSCEPLPGPVPRALGYQVPVDYRDRSYSRFLLPDLALVVRPETLDEGPRGDAVTGPLRTTVEQMARSLCADVADGGTLAKASGTRQRETWTCEGAEPNGDHFRRVAVVPSGTGKLVWTVQLFPQPGEAHSAGEDDDYAEQVFLTAATSAASAADPASGDAPPPDGYVSRTVANVRLLVPSCGHENGSRTKLVGPDGSELSISQDEDGSLPTDDAVNKYLQFMKHLGMRVTVLERHPVTINGLRGTYVHITYLFAGGDDEPKTEHMAILHVPGDYSLNIVGRTQPPGSPERLKAAWGSFVGSIRWWDAPTSARDGR